MKSLVVFLLFALFLFGFPQAAGAQKKTTATAQFRFSATSTPPAGYYQDDSVRYKSERIVEVKHTLHQIIVGGNPQWSGMPGYELQADEEWYTSVTPLPGEIFDASGTLYIGEIPTGQELLRNKVTGKVMAIRKCGNWARAYVPTPCPPPCKSDEWKLVERKDLQDGSYVAKWVNGCGVEHTETIMPRTVASVDVRCEKGTWRIVGEKGNPQGKLGEAFKVKIMIDGLSVDDATKTLIMNQIKMDKASYALILQGACKEEQNQLKIVLLAKGGGGWSWFSFTIGYVAGFLTCLVFDIGPGMMTPPTSTLPPDKVRPGEGNPHYPKKGRP